MLSTSLERSALGKIWKPAPFPLCCKKAPDLSVILISLPFLLPPPSLQPLIYWIRMDLFCLSIPSPLPSFFKILSKISDQRQRWRKLKSRLPRYFIRNLLFSEQSCCVEHGAACIVVLWLAPEKSASTVRWARSPEPIAAYKPLQLLPTTALGSKEVH